MKHILHSLLFVVGFTSFLSGQIPFTCDSYSVNCSAYSQTVYNRFYYSMTTGMPTAVTFTYHGLDSTDYIRMQLSQPGIRNSACIRMSDLRRNGIVIDSNRYVGFNVYFFREPGLYELSFDVPVTGITRNITLDITYDSPSAINQLPIGEKQVSLTQNNTLQVEGMDIEGTSTIGLYDVSGRLLGKEQFNNPRGETWMSKPISTELPAGIYFWQIQHAEKGLLGSGKLPKF